MNRHPDFQKLKKEWGIVLLANDYLPEDHRYDCLALDAQPPLVTSPSSAIPYYLTSYTDPESVRIVQSPNEGANILGEKKIGDWTTQTYMVPVVENTGEVSSYGDFNTNGRSDANVVYPQRQFYMFQTVIEYGDREIEIAGAAKLNWVSELQISAASTINKFFDQVYHFGVAGLQNYGLLNDPSLSAALTPGTKAAGGVKWINNNVIVASSNEVFADIQALFSQLVNQTAGRVKRTDPMTLVMSPDSEVGLTATNSYGLTAAEIIEKSFPNMKVKTSYRYATAAGNVVQLIADRFDGHDTGFCAFNEKLREHPIVRELSAYRQKKTAGAAGAIIKYPLAISQMLGV